MTAVLCNKKTDLTALNGTSIRRTALEKQGHRLKALLVRILEKTTREPTGERVDE